VDFVDFLLICPLSVLPACVRQTLAVVIVLTYLFKLGKEPWESHAVDVQILLKVVEGGLVRCLSVHTPTLDGAKKPVSSRNVGELADVIVPL